MFTGGPEDPLHPLPTPFPFPFPFPLGGTLLLVDALWVGRAASEVEGIAALTLDVSSNISPTGGASSSLESGSKSNSCTGDLSPGNEIIGLTVKRMITT